MRTLVCPRGRRVQQRWRRLYGVVLKGTQIDGGRRYFAIEFGIIEFALEDFRGGTFHPASLADSALAAIAARRNVAARLTGTTARWIEERSQLAVQIAQHLSKRQRTIAAHLRLTRFATIARQIAAVDRPTLLLAPTRSRHAGLAEVPLHRLAIAHWTSL